MSTDPWAAMDVPLDTPSAARMYDYYLGGFHNFEIDRRAADQVIALYPEFPLMMQANRAFLHRAVTFLAAQGIDQFLDIGSGIPTVGNVHEVAQAVDPAARVVYVDNDPVAIRHSEAILQANPRAIAVQADARQPDQILAHPAVLRLLDFNRPIAALVVFVLHFVADDAEAHQLVDRLRAALPSGSYLALSHGSGITDPPDVRAKLEALYARSANPVKMRSRAEIATFFENLDLVEPGLVYIPLWRPDGPDDLYLDQPERSASIGGVGRKP